MEGSEDSERDSDNWVVSLVVPGVARMGCRTIVVGRRYVPYRFVSRRLRFLRRIHVYGSLPVSFKSRREGIVVDGFLCLSQVKTNTVAISSVAFGLGSDVDEDQHPSRVIRPGPNRTFGVLAHWSV